MAKTLRTLTPIVALCILGIFLRLYHIEFGLPHSFYADEPELAEPAIKYTYELRSIVLGGDYYKMIPVSYVYGTLPTYLLTLGTMAFSKALGIAHITFDKMHIYVFQRTLIALVSFLIAPAAAALYYKLFKNKGGALITLGLALFNWKLIVLAHYVNADIIVALLVTLSFLTLSKYAERETDTKYTVLTGLLLGLAAGTKITTLMTLPLYLAVFLSRRHLRNALALVAIVAGTFIATNPFSLVFANDFAFRIYQMLFKEAGMVLDSVDLNPLKYIWALSYIATLPVLLVSFVGAHAAFKRRERLKPHAFFMANIIMYLGFFSLQSRLVDRWLLPILPLIFIYAAYALTTALKRIPCKVFWTVTGIAAVYCLAFPTLLLVQFQRNTPKSAAYIWAQQNLPITSTKLTYTEEGLDPTNKLTWAKTVTVPVYTSDGAQYYSPENPQMYDYVILSSRPLQNYKRTAVREAYPYYYANWQKFESTVLDTTKFELIREFSLPKPNLIPLSDVFIYRNLHPIAR